MENRIEIINDITYLEIIEDKTTIEIVEEVVDIVNVAMQGPPGPGVPIGGETDQILTKKSNSDYDFQWMDRTTHIIKTLSGGTTAGADLTLQSTTHATKGSIIIPEFNSSGFVKNDASGNITGGNVLAASDVPAHASLTSLYGDADKTHYGHVQIGDGIAVSSGVISVDVGTGLTLSGTSPNKKIGIDSTVVTLTGTQTLSNKTLSAPKFINTGYIADANGNEEIIFLTTTDAVNELTIANAITGAGPTISSSGADTDIDLILSPKGTGKVKIGSSAVGNEIVTLDGIQTLSNKTLTNPRFADLGYIADPSGNELLLFDSIGSATNYIQISNSTTTNAPVISADGSDTNINLNLLAKGTGVVQVNNDTITTLTAIQTLTNKTLTTPTIASFTNANHNHQNSAGGGTLDHGLALTGLTDDDHTQYVLLAGRAGGQTIVGGTAASNNLTFSTTSNTTKGSYFFPDLTASKVVKTSATGALVASAIVASDLDGTFLSTDSTLGGDSSSDTKISSQKATKTYVDNAITALSYEPVLTKGNLTESTSSVLTISGGTGSVIGSGTTIQVKQASSTVSGYLSSTDWSTFNNKSDAHTHPYLSNYTTSIQNGYFGNINLYDDSTSSHYLTITNGSNLTATRTLTLLTGDANRTLTLSANVTLAHDTHALNADNQTITSGNGMNFTSGSDNVTVTLGTPDSITSTSTNSVTSTSHTHAITGFSLDGHNHIISNIDGLQTALDAKAPISSPTFTGTVNISDISITGNISGYNSTLGAITGRISNIWESQLDEYSVKSYIGFPHDKMAFLTKKGGSISSSVAISSGSLINLFSGAGDWASWNNPSGNIVITITLPTAWSYMRTLMIQFVSSYYPTSFLIEYSKDGGSTWITGFDKTGWNRNYFCANTDGNWYTTNAIRITFREYAVSTLFQICEIGWWDASTPIDAFSLSKKDGGDVYDDINLPTGKYYKINGTPLAYSDVGAAPLVHTHNYAPNAFSTIAVSGQSNVVADSTADTLTFIAGTNVTLTTNATNDSVTINSAHPTITAATSVNNSGRTYIQDITLDSNGHITGLASATEADQNTFSNIHALNSSGTDVTNSPYTATTSTSSLNLKAGTGITLAMDTGGIITITGSTTYTHPTYTTRSISLDTSGVDVLDTLTFTSDATGHVTAASGATRTLPSATSSVTGVLTSTDWNTFNGKMNSTASTTAGYVPIWGANGQTLGTGYSVETTMTGSSSALVRADAVKTYIDGIIATADALVYKGVIDCSTNPNYPAGDKGHVYKVSVAGKIGGASGITVEAGDMVICNTDSTASGTQATVGSKWDIIQNNIDLSTLQPKDADLTAIAGLTGTGFAVRTASDTWTNRSITAGTGISITNGDGISGNVTVAHTDTSTQATVTNTGRTYIQSITLDGMGHVTGLASATETVTDTNTTYTIKASSQTGGAGIDLDAGGSGSGTDTVKFIGGTNVNVAYTDANTITISSTDTNTDTLVTQTVTTTNSTYPILFTNTVDKTTTSTDTARFGTGVKINPSTSNIYATTFTGNLTGNVTGNVSGSSGSCTGNSATATKLANARTLSLTGDVTGSGSFDGTGDLSITATVADDSHKHTELVPFVSGTQTSSTNAFTGNASTISALYDGLSIRYWLPYAGTSSTATLNLTLSDSSTTGAKTVYFRGTSGLNTHYAAGSVISLTYRENVSISGSGSYTGWWCDADYYNGDTYDRTYWANTITAGATIYSYKLLMQGNDGKFYPLTLETGTGTTKTISTQEFTVNTPILYYATTTTVSANGTFSNVYSEVPTGYLNYTANQASWTSQLPIYLKGTILANGKFKLDNTSYTSFITQTLPTTEDGFVYILLGYMYSTTAMRLMQYHPMYEYKNGYLREYIPSHKHGNITSAGAIGSTSDLMIKTGTNGVLEALTAGSSGQYLQYDGTWSTPPDTNTDTNYYPTTFTWSNGTTAGPTGSLTGSGMSAVSFGAIPSASDTVSGIINTDAQTIAGAKTFTSNIVGNITGNVSGSSGSCTGNSATATLSSTVTTTADTTNELIVVGVTSGATTTLKRDTNVTVTNDSIKANNFKMGTSAYMTYNSTTECIEFIFN